MDTTSATVSDRPIDVRTALLDAAAIEIGDNGAGEVSLRAVARRANVSHQAPAHFFANRRGMLTALAARSIDHLRTALEETVKQQKSKPALLRLAILGMTYVDFTMANRGLFTLASSPDQIDIDDPTLDSARRSAWVVLADTVAEAQLGGWRAEEDTETVALACWALVHGSAGLWRGGWMDSQSNETSREAIWKVLTTVL